MTDAVYGTPKYGEARYGDRAFDDAVYGAPKYGEARYGTRVQALADGIALSDAVDSFTLLLTDGIVLSEAAARVLTIPLADGVMLCDMPSDAVYGTPKYGGAVYGRRVSSPVGVVTIPVPDGVTLSDAAVREITIPLADGVSLGDAVVFTIPLADGVTLSDAAAREITIPLVDGVTLGDVAAREITIPLADGVTLGDVLSACPVPRLVVELQSEADGAAPDVVIYLVRSDAAPALLFVSDALEWAAETEDATVRFRMRRRDAEPGDYVADVGCQRIAGGYLHVLRSGDTAEAGEFYAEVIVEIGPRTYTSETFLIRVREAL